VKIVYEDAKVQIIVDEKTSTLYFHRKFAREWGPAVQIKPTHMTEITIDAKDCPVVVNLRPK
jgi:hypothetical protein